MLDWFVNIHSKNTIFYKKKKNIYILLFLTALCKSIEKVQNGCSQSISMIHSFGLNFHHILQLIGELVFQKELCTPTFFIVIAQNKTLELDFGNETSLFGFRLTAKCK